MRTHPRRRHYWKIILCWYWNLRLQDGEYMLQHVSGDYLCWCSTTGDEMLRDKETAMRYDGVMHKHMVLHHFYWNLNPLRFKPIFIAYTQSGVEIERQILQEEREMKA